MKRHLSIKKFRVIPPHPSTPDNISSHHKKILLLVVHEQYHSLSWILQ